VGGAGREKREVGGVVLYLRPPDNGGGVIVFATSN